MKLLAITSSIILLSAACNFGLGNKNLPEPVFCTQEAKQCPDGSYVGRTGPNCEFASCPELNQNNNPTTNPTPSTSTDAVFCTQDAKLCPDGSYVGRVGSKCEFAPCPTRSSEVMF